MIAVVVDPLARRSAIDSPHGGMAARPREVRAQRLDDRGACLRGASTRPGVRRGPSRSPAAPARRHSGPRTGTGDRPRGGCGRGSALLRLDQMTDHLQDAPFSRSGVAQHGRRQPRALHARGARREARSPPRGDSAVEWPTIDGRESSAWLLNGAAIAAAGRASAPWPIVAHRGRSRGGGVSPEEGVRNSIARRSAQEAARQGQRPSRKPAWPPRSVNSARTPGGRRRGSGRVRERSGRPRPEEERRPADPRQPLEARTQ